MGFDFTSLPLEAVLAVAGGALAALVAAFLVRPGRKVVIVPWIGVIRAGLPDAVVRMSLGGWPRRLIGLFIAIAAALAIAFSSGGPSVPPGVTGAAERTVMVIDSSPGMAAVTTGGTTRFDAAKQAVLAASAALGPDESVVLALGGARLVPIAPWRPGGDAAREALASIAPGRDPLDLASVLADASVILGSEGGRVVLFSDMAFGTENAKAGLGRPALQLEGIGVQATGANLALGRMSARLVPGRRDLADVVVSLAAFGGAGGGQVILESSTDATDWTLSTARYFQVKRGEAARLEILAVPLIGPFLRARVSADCLAESCNALAIDDESVVRIEAARPLRVLLVGPPDHYLESALAVQSGISVSRTALMPLAAPAGVDIMIVERTRGRVPDGIAALLLRPMPGNGRVETSGELGQARFEAAQGADTLVQGVLAGDIRVFSAARLRPRPTDIVVLASREGVPLLLRRDAPGERTVALAFSPGESDLPLKYAWPVLLSNVLGWADGSRDTFGTAPPPLPESESAIEARVTLPEFSGSHETAWEAFVRSMARNMGLIAAAVALWLLLVEWAVAMRRPDAAV